MRFVKRDDLMTDDYRRFINDHYKKDDPNCSLIQEPTDNKYLDHAAKIKAGNYIGLDFEDPEFVRNLYKCLRLGDVDLNQLLTATYVYEAKMWLCNYDYAGPQLHEFDFTDPRGPYQVTSSGYDSSDPQKLTQFYDSLTGENKKYITINFPKNLEELFFSIGQDRLSSMNSALYRNLFSKYQSRLGNPNVETTLDYDLNFLFLLLEENEKIPSVTISPDYNPNDPNTPLLCFVLPTLEAENLLQLAVHGEEAVMAAPVLGEFGPRLIRAFSEIPEAQSSNRKDNVAADVLRASFSHLYERFLHSSRPIEFTHPDVPRANTVHNHPVCPFLATYHDRFHAWQNGANFKKLIFHERNLLTRRGVCQEKEFVLSSRIWNITDMVYQHGRLLREKNPSDDNSSIVIDFIFNLVKDFTGFVFEKIPSDLFLLQFIDMVNNAEFWNSLLNGLFDNRLRKKSYLFSDFVIKINTKNTWGDDIGNADIIRSFQQAFNDKELLGLIGSNKGKPTEYIILQCKLRNVPDGKKVCDALNEIGLQHFLYWRDDGLYFKAEFEEDLKKNLGLQKFDLSSLSEMSLCSALLVCAKCALTRTECQKLGFPSEEEKKSASSLFSIFTKLSPKDRLKQEVKQQISSLGADKTSVTQGYLIDEKTFLLALSDYLEKGEQPEKISFDQYKNFSVKTQKLIRETQDVIKIELVPKYDGPPRESTNPVKS